MPPDRSTPLEILFEDDRLITINKPHGLLVHRTRMAEEQYRFAVQLLRDQIGQRVYPVHRLDGKTSGVLLFAKDARANSELQQAFMQRGVEKRYLAIVRGYLPEEGRIDYPLTAGDRTQDAQTEYRRLRRFEIPLPLGKFPTSRYSLAELSPLTGRYHQLRKHLAHIFHPIIGDRPHGCNKQNRLWKQEFQCTTMLLHASFLQFSNESGNIIKIEAPLSSEFQRALRILNELDLPHA